MQIYRWSVGAVLCQFHRFVTRPFSAAFLHYVNWVALRVKLQPISTALIIISLDEAELVVVCHSECKECKRRARHERIVRHRQTAYIAIEWRALLNESYLMRIWCISIPNCCPIWPEQVCLILTITSLGRTGVPYLRVAVRQSCFLQCVSYVSGSLTSPYFLFLVNYGGCYALGTKKEIYTQTSLYHLCTYQAETRCAASSAMRR